MKYLLPIFIAVCSMDVSANSFMNFNTTQQCLDYLLARDSPYPKTSIQRMLDNWSIQNYRERSMDLLRRHGFENMQREEMLIIEFNTSGASDYQALYIPLSKSQQLFYLRGSLHLALGVLIIPSSKDILNIAEKIKKTFNTCYRGHVGRIVFGRNAFISTYLYPGKTEKVFIIDGSTRNKVKTQTLSSIQEIYKLLDFCGIELY